MKRAHGFTLMEVMIAIAILVSSVFVLNDLQIRSLFRIVKDREEIERVFFVKRFLYHAYMHPKHAGKKAQVTKYEEPELAINTSSPQIVPKSGLHKLKDLVKIFYAEGNWKTNTGVRQIKMMMLLRKEPDAQKKK